MNYQDYNIPNHVAIIMDGNGRWATERGLKRSEGHKAGDQNLKKLAEYILSKGIKYLSVYAFSTENFKRSEEEVSYLMNLFATKFAEYQNYFNSDDKNTARRPDRRATRLVSTPGMTQACCPKYVRQMTVLRQDY